MRTSEFAENELIKVAKLLGFGKEPKWLTIRYAISISLGIEKELSSEKIDFSGGKTYSMEVITGKGKVDLQGEQADYTDFFGLLITNYEDSQISSERSLEMKLEQHCERGFQILASSLKESSDIYEWMKHEFL